MLATKVHEPECKQKPVTGVSHCRVLDPVLAKQSTARYWFCILGTL